MQINKLGVIGMAFDVLLLSWWEVEVSVAAGAFVIFAYWVLSQCGGEAESNGGNKHEVVSVLLSLFAVWFFDSVMIPFCYMFSNMWIIWERELFEVINWFNIEAFLFLNFVIMLSISMWVPLELLGNESCF